MRIRRFWTARADVLCQPETEGEMKKWKKTAAAAVFAACAWSVTVFAASKTNKAAPENVSLTADGDVSWSAPGWDGVDKYEIQLLKGENASTASKYKTKKINSAEDTEGSVSIDSKGYYYAQVRAYDVSGNYTDWSAASNRVTVTTDDLRSGKSGPGVSSGSTSGGPGVTGSGQGTPSGGSGGPGTAAGSAQTGTTATYGWQQDSRGRWYRRVNGTYPVNQWEQIDGVYYHFDASGYMQTGWIWESKNSSWYLCLPDGKLATGWNNVNERWYYLAPESGVMYAGGLHLIDGKYYCMDEKGARIENAWNGGYYYGKDGVRVN